MLTNAETKMAEDPKVHLIPAENLPRLQERILALVKRADKIGCPPVVLKVSEPIKREEPVRDNLDPDGVSVLRDGDGKPVTRTKVVYEVSIEGGTPKFAGWEFMGTIQHLAANGENDAAVLLRAVPGKELPKTYREAKATCDHCGYLRRRKETFVVRNENGEWKQVGRQCIADFLGHQDPEQILQAAEYLLSVGDVLSEAEGAGWGGGARVIWLADYLSYVALAVRTEGWLSRSKARQLPEGEMRSATADLAFAWMTPFPGAKEQPPVPVTEDAKLAQDALAWLRGTLAEKAEKNDYEFNLVAVCSRDAVVEKGFGIAASLITVYKREMGFVAEQKIRYEREAKSEHFGTVGAREVFTLTVTKVINSQSEFGVTYIHKMVDPKGNVVTWFATNGELEVGKTYQIKATVKKHDEYKGIKQTVLTRCAVEGTWFCPDNRCRSENVPHSENPADTCHCGTARGSWCCLACSHVNRPEVKVCECGHDLKSWRCNRCFQYNVRKAKTCTNKVARPGEPGVEDVCGTPKGYVKCGGYGCGTYNAPKTEVCPKCRCDRHGDFWGGEEGIPFEGGQA